MDWIQITDLFDINTICKESHETPCIIFKHSTSCSISHMAKMRIDGGLSDISPNAKLYFLDILSYREISNAISEAFNIIHESPQILVIVNGICTYNNSHLDISLSELIDQTSHVVYS